MIRIPCVMLLLLSGSAAMAEEFPRFDVEAMCRAAPALGGNPRSTDQNCVRDETQARNQLQQRWSSLDARQRDICVQETNIGGSPSYVEIVTCLEMANDSGRTSTPGALPRR